MFAVFGNHSAGVAWIILIHAHVQFAVEAKREAALLVVEVMKRHAQVGKNAVHAVHAVVAHKVLQKGKIAVYECKSGVVDAVGIGVHILVETIKVSVAAQMLHYGARVTTATKGDVDIGAVGLNVKSVDALVQQCRYVISYPHTIHKFTNSNFRPSH